MSFYLNAQEEMVDYKPVNKLKLYYDEYYIQFEFAIGEELENEINDELIYYWYKENKINNTQGGIGGKTLHGNYSVFYNSGTLKEKGQFIFGLKNGKWKKWYNNGNLYEVGSWEKGQKTGSWIQYDSEGRLAKVANYKDGELDGDYIEYSNGEISEKKKFNEGNENEVKEKKHKEKKQKKKNPKEKGHTKEDKATEEIQ
ncbi:MAG: hypothetical protein R2764_23115 [Bacteroidales bacterium]